MPYRSVLRPGLFAGQTIVVTGGGSGIGRCTAHELASLGAHVAIAGRKPDKLAAVKAEIEQSGGSCETHAFDIREEMQVKDAIAAIVAKNGRIHGLFNNAGGQFPSPAESLSAKGFDVVVRNNLTGGFIVSREVYTQSMQHHGGSIVNISSVLGLRGAAYAMAYCASKGAVRTLTKNVALYCAFMKYNIRCNSVHPGYIDTPMIVPALQATMGNMTGKQFLEELHPLGRLGQPKEVADMVLFLLSDESTFSTGSEFVCDGGLTA